MSAPRILTFNFHEPYLCLMAKIGLELDVGQYASGPLARTWQTQFRPLPSNLHLVDEQDWRVAMRDGAYDLVIAHNESNAADLMQYDVPGLLVCHNRRSFLETSMSTQGEKRAYEDLLARLRERFQFVFISASKRSDYGLPGRVIYPGIDVDEYGGYEGKNEIVLRVGNAMRARNLMFDVDMQEAACRDLPNRVVGEDPLIPAATPSKSWEDLKSYYRSSRCYLHVTREEWEDGYNLAMLEAMATGMPIVSLSNKTSPMENGVTGYVEDDAEGLHRQLKSLLDDPDRAHALGRAGRESVAERFPMDTFIAAWEEAIHERLDTGANAPNLTGTDSTKNPEQAASTPTVLMQYTASPFTTGRYFEAALIQLGYSVLTVGHRIPEALLHQWGFSEDVPKYEPHDFHLVGNESYRDVLANVLPEVDLFFFVDSGRPDLQPDFDAITCPKVCFLIDVHLDIEWRIELAKQFDFVFIAQRDYVEKFHAEGVPNAMWLPLACSPHHHGKFAHTFESRPIDIAYVGSLNDSHPRRGQLLELLKEKFPNHRIEQVWPEDMARLYAQAKIVVNAAVGRDVNMRVFEALASGALLVTDEADGLEDLFEDGKHLVIYRQDEDLFERVEYYLEHNVERSRIAAAGNERVTEEHTYSHRTKSILEKFSSGEIGDSRFGVGGYYRSRRPELTRHVPATAQRVLDVGCGGGELGWSLKQSGVKEVVGIEIVERAWSMAKQVLDDALLGSIETLSLPFSDGYFDCIICGDVLEHLRDPVDALKKLERVLSPDGIFLISIPNVRFFQVVHMLAHGRWKYEDSGIMDRTHLKFFTREELVHLIEDAGLKLRQIEPLSMVPSEMLPLGEDRTLTLGRMTMSGVSEEEYEEFRVFQYLLTASRIDANPLQAAQRALLAGDHDEAYRIAKTSRNVDEAQSLLVMSRASAALNRELEGLAYAQRAQELEPENWEIAAHVGVLLEAVDQYEEAIPLLQSALTHRADDHEARAALGLALRKSGEPKQAYEQLSHSLNLNFENESILRTLVETAQELQKLDEAEERVRRFTDFFPGNMDMLLLHARVLNDMGRSDEAAQRLETVLLLMPENEEALALSDQLNREPEHS